MSSLSIGSGVIFFAFYYYLDHRLNLKQSYEAGRLDWDAYQEAIRITHFASGLEAFAASPQHLFALLGITSFDIMQLAARMRSISLKARLDRSLERPPAPPSRGAPQDEDAAAPPAKAGAPERLLVTAISSDIVNFTALSEMMGAQKSADFLNRYYALWTHVASGQGGRIISINGDSLVIVVSALLGPPVEQRMDVFGDTIAVAARLDSLCRELHQDLLVSHSTYRRLSLESQASLDRIGEVLLRQSTRPVPVYTRK